MIFISKKRKIKIRKILAEIQSIATYSISERNTNILTKNMMKIIEDVSNTASEIGGDKFVDDVKIYYSLLEQWKDREWRSKCC